MIKILRKHRNWLMIVIAVLTLPFVFYFVRSPDYGVAFHSDSIGRIYSRSISQAEFSTNAHLSDLASILGLSLPNDLMTANVSSQNEAYVEFTWNRLVLQHELETFGIRPTASEITDFVKTLPRFQVNGAFQIRK